MTMHPRFDLISLVATDMARTLDFYRRLGLDIPAGAEQEPHVEATLPGGLRLAWDDLATVRAFDSGWTPPVGGHRAALAFLCASPAEVDRWYADLTADGHHGHLPPWDAPWGQRYAVLLDPDGTPVDLFAPLPTPTPNDQG
ncbi:Glyoxalase/Bleomycin resistance protein/Dioxygenase superfamily protein [Micromonospora phaseoli]|uniref:Glyoxalase/Bleomycin resistance protein/Dioxygenase superfamily protein n=2 Tax=Micromonospora phaseoli TaxID=1144548 RepID=A0A1H6YP13_9ACTN|nr:glyoxalase/bleomycin resistance protein/dioxygenase superfamily protein [Micromonospora phaseoli]GIJ76787.1 glyoxalase [Micromonospora phaseoli]SEJ43021.1 Glyoxalase/Bleomycin resistance protein/Dioxygenase superfamily protein [Micromonospora phaseoli]